jgi:uncharacterized protein with GYD domain
MAANILDEAIKFLDGKIERRELNLSPDVIALIGDRGRRDVEDSITKLKNARQLLEHMGTDARAIFEDEEFRQEMGDELFTIDQALAMMRTADLEAETPDSDDTIVPHSQRHRCTTYDFINELEVDDRPTLIALDLDETLMTSIQNAMAQLVAMVDGSVDGSVDGQIRGSIMRTIRTSNLQQVDGFPDKVVPTNLVRLVELNALSNVMVVVITKRNPDGVAEITPLLRSILPGVQIIGTINADGETVGKSMVIRNMTRTIQAEVIHFADDSEPHRQEVEIEFQDDEIELHVYEVDIKAQLTAPVVDLLMAMFE